jgi:peptide/nickel transport system permease protein
VAAYYLKKIATWLFTVWMSISVPFVAFRLLPGDPMTAWVHAFEEKYSVSMSGGDELSSYYTKLFGWDRPLFEQYVRYVYNVMFRLDFGPSFIAFPTPVSTLIAQRLPWTVGLASVSVIVSWIIALLAGTIAGWFRRSPLTTAAVNVSITLSQVPAYLVAVFLVILFAYQWELFPARGAFDADFQKGFNWGFIGSVLYYGALPAISMIIVSLAGWFLSTHSLVVNVLGEDYLLYAEAKGLKPFTIIKQYVLRNVLLPQTTGLALRLGAAVSGGLLVEMIFAYPGIGELMGLGLRMYDFNTIMACIVISVLSVLTMSLVVDLALPLIDPRLRTQTRG